MSSPLDRPHQEIQAHDPHHAVEHDLQEKGLSHNSIGLLGSTVLAISCVAPAYTLTATTGLLVSEVSTQVPVIFLAGFIPMFFAAYAYRELNKVAPDCGTSFTWTTKAFGPYIGWLGGWAAILATIIVISNLAGVAVQFSYQFLGAVFGSEWLANLWQDKLVNVSTCLAYLGLGTWIAYRGISTTAHVQYVLVAFQMSVLLFFAVAAITGAAGTPGSLSFSWDWFSLEGLTMSAFVAGLSGSIFAFWGWDSALTANEETTDSEKTPGRAALLAVVSILLTYLLVSIGTLMFAGVGTHELGLANEEIADNVFGALAQPVLGDPWHVFLYLSVVASSSASLISTFLPTTRTLLAMGSYRALPARFASIHPRYRSPSFATAVAGLAAAVFYAVLTFLSENVLVDTIYSIGIMICFYYGLTAYACIWFFRRELLHNVSSFVFKCLFPLLGGLGLTFVFLVTLRDSMAPDYGSGASVLGLGLVFVLGVGLILSGLIVIALWRRRDAEFFVGDTLKTDTPVLLD